MPQESCQYWILGHIDRSRSQEQESSNFRLLDHFASVSNFVAVAVVLLP
jgi:hypothetical protein